MMLAEYQQLVYLISCWHEIPPSNGFPQSHLIAEVKNLFDNVKKHYKNAQSYMRANGIANTTKDFQSSRVMFATACVVYAALGGEPEASKSKKVEQRIPVRCRRGRILMQEDYAIAAGGNTI